MSTTLDCSYLLQMVHSKIAMTTSRDSTSEFLCAFVAIACLPKTLVLFENHQLSTEDLHIVLDAIIDGYGTDRYPVIGLAAQRDQLADIDDSHLHEAVIK